VSFPAAIQLGVIQFAAILCLAPWAAAYAAPATEADPEPKVVGQLSIAELDGLADALTGVYDQIGMSGLISPDRMRSALLARAPEPLRRTAFAGPVTVLLVEAGRPTLDVVWVIAEELSIADEISIEDGAVTDSDGTKVAWCATTPEKRVVLTSREGLASSLILAADSLADPPVNPGAVTFALDVAGLLTSRRALFEGQISALRFAARTARFLGRNADEAEGTADLMTVVLSAARAISSLAGGVLVDDSALRCDLSIGPSQDGDLERFLRHASGVSPGLSPDERAWLSEREFARGVVSNGATALLTWFGSLDLRSLPVGPGAAPSLPTETDGEDWILSVSGHRASAKVSGEGEELWSSEALGVRVSRMAREPSMTRPSSADTEVAGESSGPSRIAGVWFAPAVWEGPLEEGPVRGREVSERAALVVNAVDGVLGCRIDLPLSVLGACFPTLEFR